MGCLNFDFFVEGLKCAVGLKKNEMFCIVITFARARVVKLVNTPA